MYILKNGSDYLPTHKIQSYREGHYAMTLPKIWAEELGMTTGQHVLVSKKGNTLILKRA